MGDALELISREGANRMASLQRITHSIPPTFDERSQVLVLGTMPSPASREGGFNYGHPRNRFWQVLAELAGEPLPTTNERKRDFCLRHHIALWDVLAECDIAGASDASIRNAVPNRLTDITHAAPIEAVFCTGAKSYEMYNRYCADEVGIPAVKLPSTSPANAACNIERLQEAYAAIFECVQEFEPPTLDVADVVALEQVISSSGTPLSELMDRAGTAVAWRVRAILEAIAAGAYSLRGRGRSQTACSQALTRQGGPLVTILCGNGNNGGDGWVAAELLAQASVPICVVCARLPEDITAQPAHDAVTRSFETLMDLGGRIVVSAGESADEFDELTSSPQIVLDDGKAESRELACHAIQRATVVVDAILGTGFEGTPRSPFLEWIRAANQSREQHLTLSVDVPSGVSAQTGNAPEDCILADETLTMIVPKPGLSAAACGQVAVAPLAYIEPLLEHADSDGGNNRA